MMAENQLLTNQFPMMKASSRLSVAPHPQPAGFIAPTCRDSSLHHTQMHREANPPPQQVKLRWSGSSEEA